MQARRNEAGRMRARPASWSPEDRVTIRAVVLGALSTYFGEARITL